MDGLIGVPLVALSEELVARLAPFILFGKFRAGWWISISSVVFGLFHWGFGPESIISAALFGLVAAWSLIRTRSLWPAVVSHMLVDWLQYTLPRLLQ